MENRLARENGLPLSARSLVASLLLLCRFLCYLLCSLLCRCLLGNWLCFAGASASTVHSLHPVAVIRNSIFKNG